VLRGIDIDGTEDGEVGSGDSMTIKADYLYGVDLSSFENSPIST